METITYIDCVLKSEQRLPPMPLNQPSTGRSEKDRKDEDSFRKNLVKQAILREEVQASILELLRSYEEKTGLTVVRVEYQPGKQKVILDAVPSRR